MAEHLLLYLLQAANHMGVYSACRGLCGAPILREYRVSSPYHKDIVAILAEPVQGEGGIKIPTRIFKKLRDVCNDKNLLFMVDEVQSGFCRTGKWFGYQADHITQDVVMVAKALGNGVPIGASL